MATSFSCDPPSQPKNLSLPLLILRLPICVGSSLVESVLGAAVCGSTFAAFFSFFEGFAFFSCFPSSAAWAAAAMGKNAMAAIHTLVANESAANFRTDSLYMLCLRNCFVSDEVMLNPYLLFINALMMRKIQGKLRDLEKKRPSLRGKRSELRS